MDSLTRYPLSIILSLLGEIDGTCLLLTNRRYVALLRDFELTPKTRPRRHSFRPTEPDVPTLIDRYNTKRLRNQKIPPNCTTIELALQEAATAKGPLRLRRLQLLKMSSHHYPILLVSYPRSGNTWMRLMLEALIGCVTGSDSRPDRSLSRQLRRQLSGEGRVDTPIVKTHWPERTGHVPFTANKAILLLRNPYDAIDSYWNMNATCSHSAKLHDSVYSQFTEKFDRLGRNEIEIWMKFHDYWMNSRVELLVVRMEDLSLNLEGQLRRVAEFVGHPEAAETRITGLVAQQRTGNRKIGYSLHRFTPQTLEYIQGFCEKRKVNWLKEFGYNLPLKAESREPLRLSGTNRIQLNEGCLVRPISCEFGRHLTAWRHSVTRKDQDPLPTVG